MKRISVLTFLIRLLCGLAVCAGGAETRRLTVLTSFLPVYCFTANVAGDLADVRNLLPASTSPHDFSFSRSDVQKIAASDLIVVNGLQLESWLNKALKMSSSAKSPVIVEAAAGFHAELIRGTPRLDHDSPQPTDQQHSAAPNPHVWLDPELAARAVTNILVALQKADPTHADAYAANAQRYVARLHALDLEIEQGLAQLKNHSIVTFHDAFAYFARRYRLQVVGVIERVPDVHPSPKYLAALGGAIRENHVTVIFTEAGAPSKLAKQIASDFKLTLAPLDTLETGPLTPTAYEDGMRANVRVLQQHLK